MKKTNKKKLKKQNIFKSTLYYNFLYKKYINYLNSIYYFEYICKYIL